MKKVFVPLKNQEYTIYIQNGLLDHIETLIDTNKEYIIISDKNIPTEYHDKFKTKLKVLQTYLIEPGEHSKSLETAQILINKMIEDHIERSTTILTIGGGVVGDLGGFIASIYMRGIPFIQVPTSLLAQVDSSVGGKVGVNAKHMKNAIGSFYQPKTVLIDPLTLQSLPQRHVNNGIAEIIKHGLIASEDLFKKLEILDFMTNIEEIIYDSLQIKKDVVIQDVTDHSIRNILNFGHTIGHALEQDSNYELLHGEAISIGMQIMAKEYNYEQRLKNLLNKYNLLVNYEYNKKDIIKYIKTDKKIKNGVLNHVFVESIGSAKLKQIQVDDISRYL